MGLKQGLFSIHYIFSQFLKKISINGRYPNSENLYKSGFYIPSGLELKNEILYVAKTIIKLFKKIDSQL